MARNAISTNPEDNLFKIFWGGIQLDSPRDLEKFSCNCVAHKKFFLIGKES